MSLLPISINTYDAFRADALARAAQNLGYDVDGYWGYQCWDLCAELWMNIPAFQDGQLWPKTGPNSAAMECWTVSRYQNAGTEFDLINGISELKRGDVIVIGPSAISSVGHIAFCDEDYNGTTTMNLLGQNQVNPSLYYGHIPTVTTLSISAFLGAFRYKAWETTPPTPPSDARSHFKWVLYANKLRNRNRL